MMERRVVSVWLPTFVTDRLQRRRSRQSGWRSKPLATVTAAHGGLRVAAADPVAQGGGVGPGLPLAEARALVPDLHTVKADPMGDERALAVLADWCGRYTPWTAVDGDSGAGGAGVWLDISGCAHLFGGERTLLDDLTTRLGTLGFRATAAVSDTPGAAWAVARFGDGTPGPIFVTAPGRVSQSLTPLPVAALRLPGVIVEELARVGVRRIGELLDLPRGPLAARFGAVLLRRLDQALGRTGEPLSPRRPVPSVRTHLNFAEPVGRIEDIELAARQLLDELCESLERLHHGARRLELTLYRVDGTCAGTGVGTSRPTRDPDHLEHLFKEKLATLDAGFGVDAIVLAATATDTLAPVQTSDIALGHPPLRDSHCLNDNLARLMDRLGNRLGPASVMRLIPYESHIPERACREVSALAPDPGTGCALPAQPRPLHLLPWPEPIEVMAPVPDHPPVMFRWQRRQHRVASATGPERIGPEWWLAEPEDAFRYDHIRDYYRVEDTDGRRFWVYRDGAYRPGIKPRWYLHGIFP